MGRACGPSVKMRLFSIRNQPSPIADLQTSFCTILIDPSHLWQIYKDVAKGCLQIGDRRSAIGDG
jgi:hypothetical protein